METMIYDFIAEFFRDKNDTSPTYRTHLWGIQNEESFIKSIGMIIYLHNVVFVDPVKAAVGSASDFFTTLD